MIVPVNKEHMLGLASQTEQRLNLWLMRLQSQGSEQCFVVGTQPGSSTGVLLPFSNLGTRVRRKRLPSC